MGGERAANGEASVSQRRQPFPRGAESFAQGSCGLGIRPQRVAISAMRHHFFECTRIRKAYMRACARAPRQLQHSTTLCSKSCSCHGLANADTRIAASRSISRSSSSSSSRSSSNDRDLEYRSSRSFGLATTDRSSCSATDYKRARMYVYVRTRVAIDHDY